MGNDRKIRAREAFLNHDLVKAYQKEDSYQLEAEFEKTRNRIPRFQIVSFLSFIGFVILFVLIILLIIMIQNRSIRINISDFDDIQLKEILQNVRKDQYDMNSAREQMAQFDRDMNDKIRQIREESVRQIEILQLKKLPDDDRKAELKKIRNRENWRISQLKKDTEEKKKKLESDVMALEEKIKSYDKALFEQAVENEALYDVDDKMSVMKLTDDKLRLEEKLKQTIDDYESKIKKIRSENQQAIDIIRENHQKELEALTLKPDTFMTDDKSLEILTGNLLVELSGWDPFKSSGQPQIDRLFEDRSWVLNQIQMSPASITIRKASDYLVSSEKTIRTLTLKLIQVQEEYQKLKAKYEPDVTSDNSGN